MTDAGRTTIFRRTNNKINNKKKNMKKIIATILALLTLMPGLATAKNKTRTVTYTEVSNYYHNRNTIPSYNELITTQAEFDKYFSPAAVMGKDGEPTKINFGKQVVVPIMLSPTDRDAEIKDLKIVDTGKDEFSGKEAIHLTYTVNYGPRRSFVIEPMCLVAIDAKYRGATVYNEPVIRQADERSTDDYRYVHYLGYNGQIDLSIDCPLAAGNLRNAVIAYESDILKGAVSYFSLENVPPSPAYNGENGDADTMLNYYIGLLTTNIKNMDKANGMPYRPCTIMYKILRTDDTDRYLTIEASGYAYTGGAHGSSFDRGATFNKATARKASLVKDCMALRKLITAKLPAEVTTYTQDNPVPFPANGVFYKNGTLVFQYESDEIAAHAVGKIIVTLYPAQIHDYLTEEGIILTEMN